MDVFYIVFVGTIATLTALILKDRAEIALVISIAAGIIILSGSAGHISDIIEVINSISIVAGIEDEYIKTIFKVSGIAICVTLCTSICRDNGQSAVAAKVEIAGRAAIIAAAVPVINNLFNVIVRIIR